VSHAAKTLIVTDADPDADESDIGSRKPWLRMAGMGIELASITLGLAGLGFWIDSQRGHVTPYATALGALVGFSYGMFRFIQKAIGRI
jgi:hypothetical protein